MKATTTPTRPALRWHGGKMGKAGVLADWIVSHLPPHECYAEPFGGGASVLLRKPRCTNEVYNDLFGEVVTFFRVLRDREDDLIRAVRLTPFAETEHRAAFEAASEPAGEPAGDELEIARRLAVRSWMSIGHDAAASYRNSGFRSGTKTAVRDSGMDWRNLPAALHAAAARLQGVHIYERPYNYILRKYDGPATAFYVDPPYLHETRAAAHRNAYAHEMTRADHVALLDRLRGLGGMVLVSGYDSDLYRDALADWHRVERRVFANGRGAEKPERLEVLWLNPAAAQAREIESARTQTPLFAA